MDWSYVAGMLDGEGTINLGRNKQQPWQKTPTYYCRAKITNTNMGLLKKIQEFLGYGEIYGIHQDNKTNIWKKCYELTIRHDNIKEFLQHIKQYLLVKKQQALLILEYMERNPYTSSKNRNSNIIQREFFYTVMKELNRRGRTT